MNLQTFSFGSRLSLTGEEYEKFWKNIQFTVDKDVVRTDRSHPFFTGQDNPNVEKMRYVIYMSFFLV